MESDEQELVDRIRHRKGTIISGNILKNANNKSHIPRKFRVRTTEDVVDDLDDLGHDTTKLRGRARTQLQRKRKRMTEMHGDDDGEQDLDDSMDMEMTEGERAAKKLRGRSRTARSSSKSKKKICELSGKERSISRARPRDASQSVLRGFADQQSKDKANTLMKIGQRKINQYARAGEADRRNYDMMPKHLFSGKRGIGKTDRR